MVFQAIGPQGPSPFAKLYTYAAGTSTPQATYTDSTGGTPNTNPVIMNSYGQASVWLDPTLSYKFVLTDEAGNQLATQDNIQGNLAITGSLIPASNNLFDLGSASDEWRNGYFGTQLYIGTMPVLTNGNIGYWARTAAEIAASVTPTNYAYPSPNLFRYGAKIDGATDDTTAINNAIKVARAGIGYILHPGGNCVHASQILSAGGYGVLGFDRAQCLFTYTGSAASSAWRITNNGTSSPTVNTSGSANWYIDGVTITTAVAASTAAGLEINACGYSFYDIKGGARITGSFKWGVIFDGTEVASVQTGCIIDNAVSSAISGAANVWIVNGPDRTGSQSTGYSNRIIVQGAQLNVNGTGVTSYNIVDDGGTAHSFLSNNYNGASIPLRVCAVECLRLDNGEIENALGGGATGTANLVSRISQPIARLRSRPVRGLR